MLKDNKKEVIIFLITFLILISLFLLSLLVRCNRRMNTPKEIERKWLINDVRDIPYDLSKAKRYDIFQTYISYSPEIRIRKINNGEYYLLTIKSDMSIDGLTRNEQEFYIPEEEYERLLTKKEGNTIHKVRYSISDKKGYSLEFDVFSDELEGLVYMEIEFENEKEAKRYQQPKWVKKDITGDKRYKNQSLSQFGIPKE